MREVRARLGPSDVIHFPRPAVAEKCSRLLELRRVPIEKVRVAGEPYDGAAPIPVRTRDRLAPRPGRRSVPAHGLPDAPRCPIASHLRADRVSYWPGDHRPGSLGEATSQPIPSSQSAPSPGAAISPSFSSGSAPPVDEVVHDPAVDQRDDRSPERRRSSPQCRSP